MALIDDYEEHDGLALAELLRTGQVCQKELFETFLHRFEERNPRLNAVIEIFEEEMAEALSRESRQHPGSPVSQPFAGLPMLMKDLNVFVKGRVTSHGSAFFDGTPAAFDSVLTQRYREAGLVIAGRTTSPECGLSATTESKLYGATHNPWQQGISPGGSSGGAAAAVASGIVPFAHASDGGGSIRIPASACGLFGLKPTRGRIPYAPALGEGWNGMATMHVVTRSVRDSAALLDISHGYVAGDPYAAPHVGRPFLEEVTTEPRCLRIAFTTRSPLGLDLHPDCVAAVEHAAKLCAQLGHEIKEAMPVYDHALMSQHSSVVIQSHLLATLRAREQELGRAARDGELEAITLDMLEGAKALSAVDYAESQRAIHRISRELSSFWNEYDLYLTPTLGLPPLPHGEALFKAGDRIEDYGLKMATYTPFASLANVTGQPSMSVPLFWNQDDLPIGSCFTGAFGDEASLFQLAGQLEEQSPWFDRRPTLAV